MLISADLILAAMAAPASAISSASFLRGGAGGGAAAYGPQEEPGSDLEYRVEIGFWDAVRGAVKKITITRLDTCQDCHGTGAIGRRKNLPAMRRRRTHDAGSGQDAFQCCVPALRRLRPLAPNLRKCNGEGRVRRTETLDIRIPAGVKTVRASASLVTATPEPTARPRAISTSFSMCSRIRISSAAATTSTPRVPITVSEAALGAKIEVPTIDGRTMLRIPPGSISGQKSSSARKRRALARKPGKRGDLYVELQVVVPEAVDERVRNLLKELSKLAPEDPRQDLFTRAGV